MQGHVPYYFSYAFPDFIFFVGYEAEVSFAIVVYPIGGVVFHVVHFLYC